MEFLCDLFIAIAVFAGAVCLIIWLYILKQGNARFEFLVSQRSQAALAGTTKERVSFKVTVPFVNSGTQDGTIIDLFPRHFLPQEQFDKVTVVSYLERTDAERSDGYWEAFIVPKKTGGIITLTVEFTAKEGDIKDALKEMVDMPVSLICQIVSRSKWYLQKTDMCLTKKEIAQEMKKLSGDAKGVY